MSLNKLKSIIEEEGILFPIEFKDLPFIPKRTFIVMGVPRYETRGKHAHFKTEQVLICLQGIIEVKTHDGIKETKTMLSVGDSIYIPRLTWDEQTYVTGNDILLSLCSTEYDPDDYIHDINFIIDGFKE